MVRLHVRAVLMGICFGLVFGCGGGGSGGSSATPVASSAGVARGTITGFGSVYLNGTRYDTASASFSRSGEDSRQGDFAVGMVVKIRGDIEGHRASRVEYKEDVEGPVDEVLTDGLRVMGQVVLIGPQTKVAPGFDLAAVVAGDVVEVSGMRNASDEIEATFVEAKDPARVRKYQVLGQIRGLDSTQQTFRIGGLTVDYSTAEFDDFTEADLADAQLVDVEDEQRGYSPGDLRLVATEVGLDSAVRCEDEDDIGRHHGDGDDAKVEGLITQFVDATHIVVSGVAVTITSSTVFAFGDATNLAVGADVEVHGMLAGDGTVSARKIEFAHNAARVAGLVESVDASVSLLKVFGVTIDPVTDARFRDERDGVTPFGVADIVVGDFIEARGVATDTAVLGHEIERDRADDTRLRGAASHIDVAARSLTILGVPVVTDASTEYKGGDDEETLSAAEFFAALHEGQTPVDAHWDGTVTDPSVAVKELSLED